MKTLLLEKNACFLWPTKKEKSTLEIYVEQKWVYTGVYNQRMYVN